MKHLLTIQGADLAVWDEGDGPVVLLVHGYPLDHRMWSAQIEALRGSHRVIAPDLPGFGQSEVRGETATMAQMADDLAAMLDELHVSKPVAFCGLSMGGYIGWEFWRRHRPRVARLILCDTRSAADSREAAAGRRVMAAKLLAEGMAGVPEAMLPKLLCDATRERQPNVVKAVMEMILPTPAAGAAAALCGMAERPDSTPLLAQIDVPTLVLVGEHDSISPVDEMRRMAEVIPHSRFAVIPDAGHLAPMENPTVVSATIRHFLT